MGIVRSGIFVGVLPSDIVIGRMNESKFVGGLGLGHLVREPVQLGGSDVTTRHGTEPIRSILQVILSSHLK